VLVDEYDSPLNHAFHQGYYKKASEFFGSFYLQALKGNSALEKACLMGFVEFQSAGIFSGLNNICVYSIADEEFSSHFGFTESEISEFLGNDESIGEVVAWYDGYRSGKGSVINPWSFVNWVISRKFNSYWVSTSAIETIVTVLTPHIESAMEEIMAILYWIFNLRSRRG
jgi:hypothetical protein